MRRLKYVCQWLGEGPTPPRANRADRASRGRRRASTSTINSYRVDDLLSKVFVINLEERQDRRAFIERQLVEVAGMPRELLEFIPAVNGRRLLRGDHAAGKELPPILPMALDRLCAANFLSSLGRRRLEAPAGDKIWGMDLTDGAVGCALSHLSVWSRVLLLERELDVVDLTPAEEAPFPFYRRTPARREYLVVEDDAVFGRDFIGAYRERVEALRRLPERIGHWDLLFVGGLDTGHQCEALRLSRLFPSLKGVEGGPLDTISKVPSLHRTTTAYVVTACGAHELMQTCFPLTFQLDTEMTRGATADSSASPSSAASLSTAYVRRPACLTLQPPLVSQDVSFQTDIQLPKP